MAEFLNCDDNVSPLLSVITVCLNCKEDFQDTVESLSNQTFKDYEFIVKDGGSTDGTQDIIFNVGADIVLSETDGGVFDAMNQALELASGEFIYFLNAGDVLYDNGVLENVATSIRESRSSIDFYYSDIVKPYARRKFLTHPKKLSEYYLFSRGLCHQSWFLRRKVYIQSHGFSDYFKEENVELGGDYFFLLEIFLNYKIESKHIPIFSAIYEGGGISTEPYMLSKRLKFERRVKRRLFGPFKYRLYQSICSIEKLLKTLFYDKYLYLLIRKINRLKRDL